MCNHFVLNNDRLSVEISYPGKEYSGVRFDWNGFITQVTLDGKHTFCVPEALEPGKGTGGCGLCGEFGIHEPVGFDETPVEEYFPKIGTGLLKRPDNEPYDFFRNYELSPINTDITTTKTTAVFYTEMPVHNGYGYKYSKCIGLFENHLKVTYSLENSGDKKISTTEYCHNFIGINKSSIGSSYSLKLPCDINMSEVQGQINVKGKTISWPDNLGEVFYCQLKDYKCGNSCSWEVYDNTSGAGMRENDSFTVHKFALWGYKHVVSPETFIKIDIEPGNVQTWSREYEFFKKIPKG